MEEIDQRVWSILEQCWVVDDGAGRRESRGQVASVPETVEKDWVFCVLLWGEGPESYLL